MQVDWEERVDPRRLHDYRVGRARQALAASDLGAVLVFDMNNVRYLTSTHIGEWARDKLITFALLTRTGEPIVWDFGSAARHHSLYCPWLAPGSSRAGLNGL
ncbi:MAG TPA: aminopeptidase P family protein, partial [Actinomycetota bacterium]|nr:aminopeptidase P family protein [Actinomycetota bacterium]